MPEDRYNMGLNTAADKSDLGPGELQVATGVCYRPGDPHRAHKLNGRSEFGDTATAAKVGDVALMGFDSATDQVVALSGTDLYRFDAGATGTPTALSLTLTGATRFSAAHADDRWYIGFGGTTLKNKVLESDYSVVDHGLVSPQDAPTGTVAATGTVVRPTASDSGFTNSAFAYDDPASAGVTFATATRSTAGATVLVLSSWTTDGIVANRFMTVKWALSGLPPEGYDEGGDFGDTGGSESAGYVVSVKFEQSVDAGSNWTTFKQSSYVSSQPIQEAQVEFNTADDIDTDQAQCRITLTYTQGTNAATLRIYDVNIASAPASGALTGVVKYAYTFYDEVRGWESARSPSITVTLAGEAAVLLAATESSANTNVTHRRWYKTPAGGTTESLGKFIDVPVAATQTLDTFSGADGINEQHFPLVPVITVEIGGATLTFPRDSEPKPLRRIAYFQGGLVGLSDQNKRAVYYTPPGFPQSMPEINIIEAFPFPENDTLLDVREVGGSAIFAASGLMIRLDGLPRASVGSFIAFDAKQIAGAPGCVGDHAVAVIPYKGRAHLAWISHDNGVLATDGHTWDYISLDIDWTGFAGFDKSKWLLHWDANLQALKLCYSSTSGGENDRYYLGHFNQAHIKQDGQPKWTGPHYGAISALASGETGNTHRSYSAHTSNGKVYLEDNSATGADASNAYNAGGDNPLIVTTRREYNDWREVEVQEAKLRHTDFGTGQTCTVAWKTGKDSPSDSVRTKTVTVALNGDGGTQFDVGRSGEYHEHTVTHTGTGLGALKGMVTRGRLLGEAGKQQGTAA